LYRGFGFAVGDQNLYLPFVFKWATPELFPNDYLLTLGYARESVTWVALSWASRLADIRLVTGVAYVLTSYLTLWAVLRLAQAWWDDRLSAWVAVLLWTPVYELPGSGMNTVDPYFTGRGLAYALCFLALLLLIRNKTAGVVCCLFGAAFVHSVSITPVVGAAALYYLYRRQWKDFAVLVAAMAGAALSLWAMAAGAGSHDLWTRYDPEWYPIAMKGAWCLFPTEWGAEIWARLILYAALCSGALLLGRLKKDAVPRPVLSWCLLSSSLMLWAISWAGTEARTVLLVQLSLMRSCLFVILLLGIVLAGWCAKLLRGGAPAGILTAGLALGGWVTDQPWLQAISMAVAAIAIAAFSEGPLPQGLTGRKLFTPRVEILALVSMAGGLYALCYHAGRTLPWLPRLKVLDQAGAVAAVLFLGWALLPGGRMRWPAAVMAVAFGLAVIVQPKPFAVQSLGQVPGVDLLYRLSRSRAFATRTDPNLRVRERLAHSIRNSVPLGATVIAPVWWDSFRVMTRRSSFVTREDMIPAEFSRSFAMEWRSRMEALYGPDFLADADSLASAAPLDEGAVLAVAKEYAHLNIRYIVSNRHYGFSKVAESGGWTLYRIGQSSGRDVQHQGP
jgi:hypothetical protein